MRYKVCHNIIHHEVEVVMAVAEVMKVDEDMEDIEDREKDVDEDK